MEALHTHRRALVEKKQVEVQERYRRALEDAQDGEGGCPRRDVAPVWRLCIGDSTQQPGSGLFHPFILDLSSLQYNSNHHFYQMNDGGTGGGCLLFLLQFIK